MLYRNERHVGRAQGPPLPDDRQPPGLGDLHTRARTARRESREQARGRLCEPSTKIIVQSVDGRLVYANEAAVARDRVRVDR